ncbi:MAG: nuclear transport factor 2 family protein [Streptosporangiaceae bacterium]
MPAQTGPGGGPSGLAERVRSALESGDLSEIRDLLDPDARWGAPDGLGMADCRTRDQIIAWWAAARAAGARAAVTEVTARAGALLVGLAVTGTPAARQAGGTAERWQVLTVRGGRITDIRGYPSRPEAAQRAGLPTAAPRQYRQAGAGP